MPRDAWGGGNQAPHIIPLHRLGIGPGVPGEKSAFTVYAWASDTCSGQVPLTVQVDLSWLLPEGDRVTVNKVAAANTVIWGAKPADACVALDESAATERVQTPGAIYIHVRCGSYCVTSLKNYIYCKCARPCGCV